MKWVVLDRRHTSLAGIRDTGIGILLVEQNVKQSLNIADRGLLIERGRIVGQIVKGLERPKKAR